MISPFKKRKIEIDKYGQFVIYGDSPWYLLPVTKLQVGADGLMLTNIDPKDMIYDVLKYNCIWRLNNSGIELPVIFSGSKGMEMAEEIVFILNRKL